ncbi:hypothetical protein WDZ92_50510 [Nostoc sp. NIES-2111]
MKALLLATALCAASTLTYAQTSTNQNNIATGRDVTGQQGTPFSGAASNPEVTGSISRNNATEQNDASNEPIRRCESYGDLSQPSRYGQTCQ